MALHDDLVALRSSVQAIFDACDSARDSATLGRLLRDLAHDIEVAEKGKPQPKGNPLDELAARRTGRATGTTGS